MPLREKLLLGEDPPPLLPVGRIVRDCGGVWVEKRDASEVTVPCPPSPPTLLLLLGSRVDGEDPLGIGEEEEVVSPDPVNDPVTLEVTLTDGTVEVDTKGEDDGVGAPLFELENESTEVPLGKLTLGGTEREAVGGNESVEDSVGTRVEGGEGDTPREFDTVAVPPPPPPPPTPSEVGVAPGLMDMVPSLGEGSGEDEVDKVGKGETLGMLLLVAEVDALGEEDREVLGEIERETRADKDTLEVCDKDRDPMGDKEAETEPMALDLEAKGLLDGVVATDGVKAAGVLVPPLTLPPPPPPDLVGFSWVPVAAAPVPVEVGEGVCAAPLPDVRLEGEGRVVAVADKVSAPLGVPLRVVSRAAVGVGAEAVCREERELNEEGEVVEVVEMEGEGLEVSAPLAVPTDDFEIEGEEEGVRVVEGVFDTSGDALSELEGLGERESLDLSEAVA